MAAELDQVAAAYVPGRFQIHSLEIRYKALSYKLPGSKQSNVQNKTLQTVREVHYTGKGDCYFISQIRRNGEDKLLGETRTAFNGDYFQEFETKAGLLSVKKGNIHVDGHFLDAAALLQPYAFLFPLLDQTPGFYAHFLEFEHLPLEKSLRENVLATEKPAEVAGKACAVLSVKGGSDYWFRRPYTSRVYFSIKDGYYPVRWEKVQEGKVIEFYEAKELATAGKSNANGGILYPKQGEGVLLDDEGKPLRSISYEVSEVKVGGDYEDELFTIDPASAGIREILDLDANTLIKVDP